MKNKKGINRKLLLTGMSAILLAVISLIGFALAQQNQTLEDELNTLTSSLNDNNYGWLTDYNVSYPYIEVYEYNSSRLITSFPPISEGLYKIFLTNLSEEQNYSQDVFDLRVKNGVLEKIDYEIYLKKKRIDEIREKLK